MMKVVIIGDVGASTSNVEAFSNAEADLFSDEIQNICKEADIVILNLEKPLTDVITPLGKCPPDLAAPTNTINGIKLLHPKIAVLANNHIMDQRVQGMQSTINVLRNHGIMHVGAGCNLEEARKPIVLTKEGYRIGVYACCEKEFSFATDLMPGANVFDPLETFDDIVRLKKSCDYLIVLYHGGMQGYPYPTPYQQKVCRKMCEKGADLVVCQHSHIIGCEEKFSNGTIVYGQGNFLLDDMQDESWHSGLLIHVTIDNKEAGINYIPIQTMNHKVILHQDSERVSHNFFERSDLIQQTCLVQSYYSDLCEEKLSDYLLKLSGKRYLTQRVMRRLGITKHLKKIYTEEACYRILDCIYCDSHREAIEFGLERHTKRKRKNKM